MLQCQWHCQPCSYGCSSVNDTVNPATMNVPVSMTLLILQLWMLQCQWHCQPCSYGCSSVCDIVNPAAMDAPVSMTVMTLSTLQLWMLQCQLHWSIHSCRVDLNAVASVYKSSTESCSYVDDPNATLMLWMLQCQWHWSIHNCRVDTIMTQSDTLMRNALALF